MYQLCLDTDQSASHSLEPGRTMYVHVVSGAISVDAEQLSAGDGAAVTETSEVEFVGIENCEVLAFDLP